MGFRNPETVVFIRAGATDQEDTQGNPLPGDDVERPSKGWAVAPVTSTDTADAAGQEIIVGYQLFKPHVIEDVSAFDRARVRGKTFAVVGEVGDWVSPFASGRGGTVVNVKRGT